MPANKLIDMHVHIFNGFYIPLEEWLHHGYGIAKNAARPLAYLLELIIAEEPEMRDETLRELFKKPDNEVRLEMADQILNAGLNKLKDDIKDLSIDKAADQLIYSKTYQAFSQLIEVQSAQKAITSLQTEPQIIHKFAKNLFEPKDTRHKMLIKAFSLNDLIADTLDLLGAETLRFVAKFMQHDGELAKDVTDRNYPADSRPDLSIHHMMDIEPTYWDENGDAIRPRYLFQTDQIAQGREYVKAANGRLLGFVAFDPRRGEEGLDKCFKALEFGNIGIKFYPPMGYKPQDYKQGKHVILEELYRRCVKKNIPIMTHCTPVGFIAWKEECYGLYSDPRNWEKVLLDKRFEDLRLCFAHAGGGRYDEDDGSARQRTCIKKTMYGWYCEDPVHWNGGASYPGCIVKLCKKYKNVYTDFSYLTGLMEDNIWTEFSGHGDATSNRNAFINNLIRSLEDDGNYPFNEKIIYGSDWHMPSMISKTNDYLQTFQDIFAHEDLNDYKDNFFYKNAIKYLRLKEYIEQQTTQDFLGQEAIDHLRALVENSGL